MTTDPGVPGSRGVAAAYGGLWTIIAALTHTVGLIAAMQRSPWQAVVAFFLTGGLLAGTCRLSLDSVRGRQPTLAPALRTGLVVGVGLVATLGMGGLLGGAGVTLLVCLYVVSPACWRWVASLAGPSPDPVPATAPAEHPDAFSLADVLLGAERPEPSPPAPQLPDDAPRDWDVPVDPETWRVPDHMTDEDLCLAWQSSSQALKRCSTVEERLRVVDARQACLDELERRRPKAFQAWLADGASGTRGLRYFSP